MASHSKGKSYIAAFGDLSPADPFYAEQAYERVLAGGAYIDGRWRKIKCFPNNFWDKGTAYELARYFVFKMKRWGREEVCANFTTSLLREYQLAGINKQFGSSTYEIVKYCFPEWDIKPWELSICPNAFWKTPANCAEACVWVCQKEGIAEDKELFCRKFSAKMLEKHGIGKAMEHSGGLYELAKLSFPHWNLKPWHMNKTAKITKEIVIDAVKWMIEEKLKWTHEQVCQNISVRTFYECGIGKVLMKGCHHSPIEALQIAYPGQYERSMLANAENPFRK